MERNMKFKNQEDIKKYLTTLDLAPGDHIKAAKAFCVLPIDQHGVQLPVIGKLCSVFSDM